MSFLLDEEKTWFQRDFGLDRRLIKAIAKLGFSHPTLVQAKCLPIALKGKDILIRARTGAGKTIAFALPLLQKVLIIKEKNDKDESNNSVKGVVLAPTKELVKQIEAHMNSLIYYCRENITICSFSDDNLKVQKYRLQSKPDIIISTPARLAQHLKSNNIDLSQASSLIIDEADLVLSYGYTEDTHKIIAKLPKIFQSILVSATLSAELEKFKKVVLHNPVILKLEEPTSSGNLMQFFLESSEEDKYLIIYVFIKLGLLQGKGLIFVNDVNKCYRLKLFLQQFFISAAVLNAQVPFNSRIHILEEFNRGVFDFLIATDAGVDPGQEDEPDNDNTDRNQDISEDNELDEDNEEQDILEDNEEDNEEGQSEEEDIEEMDNSEGQNDEDNENDDDNNSEENEDEPSEEEEPVKKQKNKKTTNKEKNNKNEKKTRKPSKEEEEQYGVSRGIDFQGVQFVVNFDFPITAAAYTHRIGRTARGLASGTALSFITAFPTASATTNSGIHEKMMAERDHEVLVEVQEQQPRIGLEANNSALSTINSSSDTPMSEYQVQPSPLVFNRQELESFRYRVEDILRSVTTSAVRELRAAEIKQEIINSEKLQSYFAQNPNDLKVLRHDKSILHPIRAHDHLKHVPQYLIPQSMRGVATIRQQRRSKGKNKRKSTYSATSDSTGVTTSNKQHRVLQSKLKDPLYGFNTDPSPGENDPTDGVENGVSADVDKVFTSKEALGRSLSGRQKWKERHKKGKFNPTLAKKNQHRMAGSFIKSKAYK